MTISLTQLLTGDEFRRLDDEAKAAVYWHMDPHVFTPGMGWLNPWYFDPSGERERRGEHVMFKGVQRGSLGFLSEHYWRDWAEQRPPLTIVCPNGEIWEVDRKSANGTGWTVTGTWPHLTATPSIVVRGYHGFLQGGRFTADCEGRPPNGIVQPYTPRQSGK